MPWFPDFVNAVQLARQQSRAAGEADSAPAAATAVGDFIGAARAALAG